jgi:hypothetical protein
MHDLGQANRERSAQIHASIFHHAKSNHILYARLKPHLTAFFGHPGRACGWLSARGDVKGPCGDAQRAKVTRTAQKKTIDSTHSNSYHDDMSNQQEQSTEELAPTDGSEESTAVESHFPAEKREPSQYERAMMIADRLGEVEEARRKHILSLVRTLGRTQAQALLDETEQQSGIKDGRTAGEVFCDLAYTKGRLKASQVWGRETSTHTSAHPPGNKVVARKIGRRLGETHVNQSILLKHVVGALGQVQAWALMLDALEIEAHGGMMVLSDARRRTVGGIFLYLVSTKGIPFPGKVLKRYPPKDPQKPSEPGEQSAGK